MSAILSEIPDYQFNIYLACTAEDAAFLAKGMLADLEAYLIHAVFTCMWNQWVSSFGITNLPTAPIIREYQETLQGKVQYLIVKTLIISSGWVCGQICCI